jgi:hypothetical protein
MLTIYLSHPFSGNEEFNRRHARKTAMDICLVAEYHKSAIAIINPCDCIRYAEKAKLPYEKCIEICLKLIDGCDALVLSKGWEKSKGCVTEAIYAVHSHIPVCILPEKIDKKTLHKKIDIQQNVNPNFVKELLHYAEILELSKIPFKDKSFLKLQPEKREVF